MKSAFRSLVKVGLAVAVAPWMATDARADGENLQIVIRTESDLTLANVERALTVALRKIKPQAKYKGPSVIDGKPIVRAITSADYNAYQRLANPDAPLVTLPSTKTDELEVRQLPASSPAWEFSLRGQTPREITRLEITYEDAPMVPVAMVPTTKKDDLLTMTQFGSYVLKPPQDKKPIRYTATVQSFGSKDEKKISGEWPEAGNFYMIRLNGFKGDRQALSDTIKDPDKVPNALATFDIKTDVTLAMGEAKSSEDVTEGIRFEGNKLYVNVPKLQKGKPRRVYMLFPLSQKEFNEQLPMLRGLGEEGLPDHIRKNLVGTGPDAVVTPESRPAWYELPLIEAGTPGQLKPGSFGRVFSLATADEKKDVDAAQYRKLLDRFPQAFQIVVYEFDDGQDRSALRYKRDPKEPTAQIANGGPMNVWAIQLAKLAGDAPASPPGEPEKK